MGNCTETPGKNITALSVDGLNKLSGYMVATAVSAYIEYQQAYGTEVVSLPFVYWPDATGANQWQAPGLTQYHNFFGVVAQGITTATTVGYYGTAEVPTTGEPQRLVYISRMYIVAIMFVIFFTVAVISLLDVAHMIAARHPLHSASFITIASSVQNSWWSELLRGRSSVSRAELRKSRLGDEYLMFGEDFYRSEK